MLLLGGDEAEPQEECRLARERQDLAQAVGARLADQRLCQRPADARTLVVRVHGEPRDFGEVAGVDLQGPTPHQAAVGRSGHHVLLDVSTEIVIAPRQEITGRHVGRHQPLQRGNVGEHRGADELGRGTCDV